MWASVKEERKKEVGKRLTWEMDESFVRIQIRTREWMDGR